MLIVVYVLNFLSRSCRGFLPSRSRTVCISRTVSLADCGLYFALFYCCISIPVGWLATGPAGRSFGIACAVWSAATMCCGGAANFLQFACAYMTVGFGERRVPPSYSIISAIFSRPSRQSTGPLQHRPRLVQRWNRLGASIAAAFSWRYAFVVLGSVVFSQYRHPRFVPEPVARWIALRPGAREQNRIPADVTMFISRLLSCSSPWPARTQFVT